MQTVVRGIEALRRAGQKFGPYLMLEILLPGGTLLALLLFLYRRRQLDPRSRTPLTAVALRRTFARIIEPFVALQPCYAVRPDVEIGFFRSTIRHG